MFERFTDRSRRVLVMAQEEARLLNHNFIGTEHLLLGLIHEGEGVAAKALQHLGVDLEVARGKVAEHQPEGERAYSGGSPPFTPRSKKVLELSLREALQLGHNYIGTEHILLGLIREGEGVGAKVLSEMGADLSSCRQTVIQLLSGYAQAEVKQKAVAASSNVPTYLDELQRRAQEFFTLRDRQLVEAEKLLTQVLDLLARERTLNGERLILDERERQVAVEGWTAAHDDEHVAGELKTAGLCYLAAEDAHHPMPNEWPWSKVWWKPKDRVSNLIRAGALLLAEAGRLSRAGLPDDPTITYIVKGIASDIDRLRKGAA